MSLLALLDAAFGTLSTGLAGLRFVAGNVGPGLPDTGGGAYTGAVGSLIGATMQTAGIFAQAEILRNFKTYLEHLAALCYLCSIIGALLSIGVFGNYSKAAYFLIGPPLFTYMITTTMNVNGAQQVFGERVVAGSIDDQTKFLKKFVQNLDTSGGAEVSRFFVLYDSLVTSVVQGTVSAIIDTKNNQDLVDKARERVFSWIYMAQPLDPGFKELLVFGLRGRCASVYSHLLEAMRYRINPQLRKVDRDNLDETGQQLLDQYDQEKNEPLIEITGSIATLVNADSVDPLIREKEKCSCDRVWRMIRFVSERYAKHQMDPKTFIRSQPEDNYTDWRRAMDEVTRTAEIGVPAEQVIAAYVIKNAMRNTAHSALTMGIFNRVPFNAERFSGIYDRAAEVHMFGGQFKLEFFARGVPYIQGLLLYLLTMSFPFFAIFLVMPGRATTFIVWCSLWVWVKSWDIGFALVGVARKIFWTFLSASPSKFDLKNVTNRSFQGSGFDWARPEAIFSIIADNDPLANQNTYYAIIAMLTCSVPLLTAHFCLGATNLYDVFKMNVDQTANRFADFRRRGQQRFMRASPTEQFQEEMKALAQLAGAVGAHHSLSAQGFLNQQGYGNRGGVGGAVGGQGGGGAGGGGVAGTAPAVPPRKP